MTRSQSPSCTKANRETLFLALIASLLLFSCSFDPDTHVNDTVSDAGSLCPLEEQDNDGDGICLPKCGSANLRCETDRECTDTSGSAECVCVTCLPVLANLLTHYDAQTASSIEVDGLGVVSLWSDRSGNGHDLTTNGVGPTDDVQINGHPALDFGGGAALARDAVPLSSEFTIFTVVQWKTSNPWGSIAHHGNRDNDWALEQVGDTQGRTHFQSNNDNANVDINLAGDNNYILIGHLAGNTRNYSVHSVDGSDLTSGDGVSISTGDRRLYLGKSDINEASNVYLGEFLYYSSALSAPDQDLVLNYLRERWDIFAN